MIKLKNISLFEFIVCKINQLAALGGFVIFGKKGYISVNKSKFV